MPVDIIVRCSKVGPVRTCRRGPQMSICILYADNRHVDDIDKLFLSMRECPARIIVHEQGVEKVGLLQSIQREDGSGRSFNVTVLVGDEYNTYYVRDSDESHFSRPRRGIRVFDSV